MILRLNRRLAGMLLGFMLGMAAGVSAQPLTLVIDPGHPSEVSSGKKVVNGIAEYEANWRVAVRLEQLLKKIPGLVVCKTRETMDLLTTNQDRAVFANRKKAALFLRIHCDAGTGNGFAIYFPDRTGKYGDKAGPPQEVIRRSKIAARCLHAGFREMLGKTLRDNGVHGEGDTAVGKKYGALIGSIFSEVPTVTVEMGFLTDPFDASLIRSPDGQDLLAYAFLRGVQQFLHMKALGKK